MPTDLPPPFPSSTTTALPFPTTTTVFPTTTFPTQKRENKTYMLDFEKHLEGIETSHIDSSDKTKLVDLNIEKKIKAIVNIEEVSPDTSKNENKFYLDIKENIIGVSSSSLSTTMQGDLKKI
jgi:hypothetical protein